MLRIRRYECVILLKELLNTHFRLCRGLRIKEAFTSSKLFQALSKRYSTYLPTTYLVARFQNSIRYSFNYMHILARMTGARVSALHPLLCRGI